MAPDRQTFTPIIRGSRTAVFNASTPEDRATYRRWARAVLACYCLVLVSGCIAALANHSAASPDSQIAQASSHKNSQSQSGR
jgi:hypothetical protein